MSDIGFDNLTGVLATIGAWAVAAAFAVVAVGFMGASLLTEKRTVYGPRALRALALALAAFAGGLLLHQLPLEMRSTLDETVAYWALPILLAGGVVIFRRRRQPRSSGAGV